jgi:hypothetical protein
VLTSFLLFSLKLRCFVFIIFANFAMLRFYFISLNFYHIKRDKKQESFHFFIIKKKQRQKDVLYTKCYKFSPPAEEKRVREGTLPKRLILTRGAGLRILQGPPEPGELLLIHINILLMGLALSSKVVLKPTKLTLEPTKLELSSSSHGRSEGR